MSIPEPIKNPADRRGRLVTMYEGKFLSVDDFKEALKDAQFIHHCLEVFAVSNKLGDALDESLRRAIGCAVATLAGDLSLAPIKAKPGIVWPKTGSMMMLPVMLPTPDGPQPPNGGVS